MRYQILKYIFNIIQIIPLIFALICVYLLLIRSNKNDNIFTIYNLLSNNDKPDSNIYSNINEHTKIDMTMFGKNTIEIDNNDEEFKLNFCKHTSKCKINQYNNNILLEYIFCFSENYLNIYLLTNNIIKNKYTCYKFDKYYNNIFRLEFKYVNLNNNADTNSKQISILTNNYEFISPQLSSNQNNLIIAIKEVLSFFGDKYFDSNYNCTIKYTNSYDNSEQFINLIKIDQTYSYVQYIVFIILFILFEIFRNIYINICNYKIINKNIYKYINILIELLTICLIFTISMIYIYMIMFKNTLNSNNETKYIFISNIILLLINIFEFVSININVKLSFIYKNIRIIIIYIIGFFTNIIVQIICVFAINKYEFLFGFQYICIIYTCILYIINYLRYKNI